MSRQPESSNAWTRTGDQLIRQLSDALPHSPLDHALPGLKSLLDDYLDRKLDSRGVEFHRRLLRTFRDAPHDDTFQVLLARLDESDRERIERFVSLGETIEQVSLGFDQGLSPGERELMREIVESDAVRVDGGGPVHVAGLSDEGLKKKDGRLHRFVHDLSRLFICFRGSDRRRHLAQQLGDVIVYRDTRFRNWGRTEDYTPTYTCIPSTVASIQRIVEYAKENDMGLRCSGFRHSWSPMFGRDGQILISLVGLHEATFLPNKTASDTLPERPPTELESIDVVSGEPLIAGNTLVRVGASVTNERLRRWCIKGNKHTLPLNVILVEVTIGGTNGPICHGSGRRHQTLSDIVRKIEYVDANGNLQVLEKPEHLRAASGCFGLMGVITHLTMEFSPMTYALMEPRRVPVVRAIPPPPDWKQEQIPECLRLSLTDEQRKLDQAEFERRANDYFYAEWFWFPFSKTVWVNCWNDTEDGAGTVAHPSSEDIFISFVGKISLNVLQHSPAVHAFVDVLRLDEAATSLITLASKIELREEKVKTYVTDALHFQRGIHNVRVLNLEVSIPLVPRRDDPGKVDYATVQRAWWDAILKCYEHSDTCPQRMPLEMRITGGSGVAMSPQRGNALGTCAIEVLTLYSMRDEWVPYAQEIVDKWMALEDDQGRRLRTRPHWAKQWREFTVGGRPWGEVLRDEVYAEERAEFMGILGEIGGEHGWRLSDLKQRFSNDFLDWFYFEDLVASGKGPDAGEPVCAREN